MEASALPIAFLAGILSLLSPCVLPMIPAVASSALRASKLGLIALASGLAVAFALAGSILTYLFLNLGLSTEILRQTSTFILLFFGLALVIPTLNEWLSIALSRLISHAPNSQIQGDSLFSQFIIGASLGLVWLPCVGPTLGTAIALAATGQDLLMAFFVMLSFGIGTALPLIALGFFAKKTLPKIAQKANTIKKVMGWSLIFLAITILTGIDRQLEIMAMQILPSWVIEL